MDWSILFPQNCIICNNSLCGNEKYICLHCENKLPKTDFHNKIDNPAEQLFMGKADIEKATSFCFYNSGSSFRDAIHEIKYGNNPRLAYKITTIYSEELIKVDWFKDIEAIVPVPLHFIKESSRGYNQSHWIAKAISDTTGIPILYNLIYKKSNTKSQTLNNLYRRYINSIDKYSVSKAHTPNKILIVDDVLTSGSTITSCVEAIRKINPSCIICVLTIAFAG